ncbi:hypothetical protein [Pseudodesulfovibrio sp. zrk46]|uniref:hypothetical protein n=1 Tax=Pseudodesulfovibrio sp. zrk46 TaxID=2725288 RepID=UPI001449ABF3|nr:hypothetical protein [Pseudodesulfovibrio sp. zrk46]QJB55183.1 hypothetical protein HFN16_01650 [Pseudodesulfovibrio sp. zrk46]
MKRRSALSIFCMVIALSLVSAQLSVAAQISIEEGKDSPQLLTFSVPVMKANYPLYQSFLAEKGANPLGITNFSSLYSNRIVVDMVLLQQALALGGLDVKLQYYAVPNPARAIEDVKMGLSPVLGFETWKSDFDDRVFQSDEIIGDGEFLKVVVGRLNNSKYLMQAKSKTDLQKLSAVTGHRWRIDQKTLHEMGIVEIFSVSQYSLQLKMLQEGRVDFGMYEYTNIRKSMPEGLGIVPGITVGLRGTRHFMVSRLHPRGKDIFEALQRGIAILKSRGAFRSAYRECGFISPELDSWKRVFP